MTKPYDADTARARIRQVFRYLQEMHRVRTPPVLSLEDREWGLRLDTLPAASQLRRGFELGSPGGFESGFVLKVSRAEESEPPEPSVVIKNWLKAGWDRPGADPEAFVKQTRKVQGKTQALADSEERTDALEEWLHLKKAWEDETRDATASLGVFSELFELQSTVGRESEKYQLWVGDGILCLEQDGARVRHPVLLQRVELTFNPAVPEFVVADTDDNPEICAPLLRHLGLDGKSIQQAQDTLDAEHFHPLGGAPTREFLTDFIQRHWKNGQFLDDPEEAGDVKTPCLYRQPHLFLGHRNQGLSESIERYLEVLPEQEDLPESLLRIVGIDTGRGESPDDVSAADILLTKHANLEQERVIRRLEETGAVLVQGPPGTGKSHTIANLIGHLLAQDKSILVTSHASKALRVVREQLAKPLQPLCVSLLQNDADSARQLEESVTGIVNYLASTSERKLTKDIEKLADKRATLRTKHDELRDQFLDAGTREYLEIEVMGERVAPSDAARRVAEESEAHVWLPGPLEQAELPLTEAELEELYRLGRELDADDDALLASTLPDLDAFPTPREFAELHDDLAALAREKPREERGLWKRDDQTPEALEELHDRLRSAVTALEDASEWRLDCLDAGRTGGERKAAWRELVELVERCAREIPEKEPLVLKHGPEVDPARPANEQLRVIEEILQHLRAGKRLGKMTSLVHAEWAELVKTARVDGKSPSAREHFEALRSLLETNALRDSLKRRWDRQIAPLGAPSASELGARPEAAAGEYAAKIAASLRWHEEVWAPCEAALEECGLDWARFAKRATGEYAVHVDLQRTRELVTEHLDEIIEIRKLFARRNGMETRRAQWLADLDSVSRKEKAYEIIKRFRTGIRRGNYDTYAEAWNRLRELIDSRSGFDRREELLGRLDPAAPAWSSAIRDRHPGHDLGRVPGDATVAWRHRHWEQALESQAGIDLDKLQERHQRVKDELFDVTAKYVEKLSWLAQLRRTGLEQQQALNGWLAIHKKIGKGTGKNTGRLKDEAKRTLQACRSAVPVWIMPLSRVAESFDLATTRFDVVILDEASQSDVMGLIAFAIAKEVVVVGDHEQVSPYAVGQKTESINALIDEILTDIPNKRLYDGKTSVYDLAQQSFGGTIRLLEHFRCVPDIIQFSNQLCYGGEIRALRDASASPVKRPLVAHRVEGGEEVSGVNKNEALEIVSLVSAVCRMPEYEHSTIGVICMVGTDQALYIDSVLRRRLTVSEYNKRQVLCGNASQFQGDERDVIFLSMVNSPSDKPLSLRQRDESRKSFNVAASRARDQLWVVHSLDPRRDLKHGDLRLQLISHAENPDALRPKTTEMKTKFTSDFQQEIYQALEAEGYRLGTQFEVGDFVVDLVAEGEDGTRVAVQCDGDRRATVEAVVESMDRQFTLERLGWVFVRLRASEYRLAPDKVLKRLFRRLGQAGIRPGEPPAEAPAGSEDELTTRVVKRAELIRQRWKDIPAVSTVTGSAEPEEAPSREGQGPGSSD
jgi:very-short-patch-repair endonuclease